MAIDNRTYTVRFDLPMTSREREHMVLAAMYVSGLQARRKMQAADRRKIKRVRKPDAERARQTTGGTGGME